MAFIDRISGDLTAAMRSKDAVRLSTLRMAKAALMNREVEKKRALDESESLQVVNSLVKQRRDSVEQFVAGGRKDLADRERGEIAYLGRFLPPVADPAAIDAAIEAAVAETGATTVKEMGRVMKAVTARLAGQTIDGRAVSEAVRKRLGG